MQAIVYRRNGGVTVPSLEERPLPVPGVGEVRVRVHVSGVNPLDARARGKAEALDYVPNHDGAGVIDAVGPGVAENRTGQRVWLWAAGRPWAGRPHPGGTAQEYVALPEKLALPLPDNASFELGASVGIPVLTAHRCLTLGEHGPARLAPGRLSGRTVLVAGGAGAVGNAAIQLARWAGATVITTVSSPAKATLVKAAGADYVVDYRAEDAAETIRRVFPGGVDQVVEVSVAENAALDLAVLKPNGVVAYYANVDSGTVSLPIRETVMANFRWQGVYLYGISALAEQNGLAAVSAALADGAFRVGEDAGLPLHRFSFAEVPHAHDAVMDASLVGKALVDIYAE
ncbi:NADPH:quinone reductase [Amycolatopsis sp. H20-H5]|uniref:NADPH:quinone reductase n=1 Tax=Amycolatopsis sp. H20-H5 TaxID=3046309 RepID=UPI002DBA9EE0|nr:NADPH:quinone reductase [Amycolatopsis sp. H20-H5]MEC3977377.1 NADPH:quinone reductase [Amycolatopsis sp. H20-H5]